MRGSAGKGAAKARILPTAATVRRDAWPKRAGSGEDERVHRASRASGATQPTPRASRTTPRAAGDLPRALVEAVFVELQPWSIARLRNSMLNAFDR